MKIRIITIHGIPNFGSVFQSYALCEHLKKCGYDDVQVIDYNPAYYNPSSIRSKIGKLLNYRAFKKREKKFRDFLRKNVPLTEKEFKQCSVLGVCGCKAVSLLRVL